jgi:hypothetical protein
MLTQKLEYGFVYCVRRTPIVFIVGGLNECAKDERDTFRRYLVDISSAADGWQISVQSTRIVVYHTDHHLLLTH